MGTKPPSPETIEPDILAIIDRYVNDVMADTPTPPRGRLARSSSAPIDDFIAPPSVDPAAEQVPEFVDESPTDLGSPPVHLAGDDEDTGVFSSRRR